MEFRRIHLKFLILLWLAGVNCVLARPDPSITPTGRKNIENALRMLERYGETSKAQALRALYRSGKMKFGPLSDANAETSKTDGTLTLDKVGFGKSMNPQTLTGQAGLQYIAKTLYHELIHLEQQSARFVASSNARDLVGDNPAELEAWSKTLAAMEKWALRLQRDGDTARTTQEKIAAYKEAVSIISSIATEIKDFPNKGYGQLTPPPGYPSVDHWLQDLTVRNRQLDRSVVDILENQPAEEEARAAQSPGPSPSPSSSPSPSPVRTPPISPDGSVGVSRSPRLATPSRVAVPSRPTPMAPLQAYILEMEERRAAMVALYDYGQPGRNTLRKAMQAQGVGYAQRYIPSWSDNGVYFQWSGSDRNFYSENLFQLKHLAPDKWNHLAQAMARWRETESQIAACHQRYLEETVIQAKIIDKRQAGGNSEALEAQLAASYERREAVLNSLHKLQLVRPFSH